MKCLHICNDLLGSKVHENLYNHLNELKMDQDIYYPVRKHTQNKISEFKKKNALNIIYSEPLKRRHRLFFKNKIRFLFKDIQSKANLTNYSLTHATTLFSDGAIALKIYQEYKIPYILNIRGTDINLFLKYRIDLYPLAKKILDNASKIIFISQSLESNFFQNPYITKLGVNIRRKSLIIPNGLDAYWLNNIETKLTLTPYKILYIGKFDKNKNILRLIKGFLKVKEKYSNITLELVGKGGVQEKEIIHLSKVHNNAITFHGPIYDKEKLKQVYLSNHIFAMNSIGETFGLVYVEALSQGLPILYTKSQGIDGTFNEYVGESVIPKSIDSISEGIKKMLNNYNKYQLDRIDFSRFSWDKISKIYFDMYNLYAKQ